MRPKQCHYCESTIDFKNWDHHILQCGSKTKPCLLCNHNVCKKDWDSHQTGGECAAFREQDEEKARMEKIKKQNEERKEKERIEKEQQQRRRIQEENEKRFRENLGFDDHEDERGHHVPQRPTQMRQQ